MRTRTIGIEFYEAIAAKVVYNPRRGDFTWLKNGKRAGCLKASYGYRYLSSTIDGKQRQMFEANVAWFMSTGKLPPAGKSVDHINGIADDNRLVNLRLATKHEQNVNRKRQSNNTSGVVGVNWYKPLQKWQTYIKVHNKQFHLGYFDELSDAVAARKAAEVEHGYDKMKGGRDES